MAYDSPSEALLTERRSMKTKTLLKRLRPYLLRYKWILFTDLFAAGLTTMCELVLPLILRKLTNLGAEDLTLVTPELLIRFGTIYLALRIVDILASYYMTRVGHIMGAKIETDMRGDAFEHLHRLDIEFYNTAKVGKIMSRLTNDLNDVTEFAHHCPEEYFIGAIKLLVVFIVLLRMNVMISIALIVCVPLMFLASSHYRKRMRKVLVNQRKQIAVINSDIEESLLGVRVVRSFANEDVELEKFSQSNDEFLQAKKDFYTSMAAFSTVTRVFDGVMYLIVIMLGGYQMMQGKILPGDLVVYALYATTLLATVRRIVEFTEQFQRGMTGIERFVEIMDMDMKVYDREDAKELQVREGQIEFQNVSFRYPDGEKDVLHDVSFTIEPGMNAALVGASGGGKTTLVNLILRFYEVTSGEILIDGSDVRDVTLKSLRESIGMVQQDVYLFSGTVRENIAYGRVGASEEDVIGAAKLAGAYEFIMELEDGFDTYVGERGVKLSGGQKQRISIARAFLKNPKILILDEATSALDNESERIVQGSLEKLSRGRTTLTIAHRLTTIHNADKILVLDDSGIKEEGTHRELMALGGLYHELYTTGSLNAETK